MPKSRKDILGFDDKWLMIIGIPLVSFIVNAILFGKYIGEGIQIFFGSCLGISFTYTVIYWISFREGYYILLKKYKRPDQTIRRLILTVIMSIVGYSVLNITIQTFIEPLFPEHRQPDDLLAAVSSFLFVTMIISLYEALHLSNRWKQASLEKERLVKENVNSQLEGLRSQVNPHFLFNSLNTLAAIIPEDPEKGVDFVTRMAKVYRYMLESRNEKLILLEEELEFLDAYLYLLQQRFSDNLKINVNIGAEARKKFIIPLSLQLTFENAIKHNVISKEHPLTMEVYVGDNGKLVVRNTLRKKKVIGKSTKVGLQNIKNRYAFYTDDTVDVLATVDHFSVMIPILKKEELNGTTH